MKTPVRTIIKKSSNGQYNLMEIQILAPKFSAGDWLEPIGSITFQQNLGETHWYGKTFMVETTNVKHLEKMTRIAKHIENSQSWDLTPVDIKKIIGAEEHGIFFHEFVPVSKKGQILFDIFKKGLPGVYTRIIAPDEKSVIRLMKKRKDLDGTEVKKNSIVEF